MFYKKILDKSSKSWNCSEHVSNTWRLFEQETQRLEECLSQSTTIRAIMKEFNKILISDYKQNLIEKGFYLMLNNKIISVIELFFEMI